MVITSAIVGAFLTYLFVYRTKTPMELIVYGAEQALGLLLFEEVKNNYKDPFSDLNELGMFEQAVKDFLDKSDTFDAIFQQEEVSKEKVIEAACHRFQKA